LNTLTNEAVELQSVHPLTPASWENNRLKTIAKTVTNIRHKN